MTYFGQSKKQLGQKIRHSSSVGPGSYSPDKIFNHSHSYAPFGSLMKKHDANKVNKKQLLGPGAYNINRQIIKPSVIQYENENCIIIKINEEGGSQFKSKQARFQDPNKNQTPGPGSYIFQYKSPTTKGKRSQSLGSAVNKMKQLYQVQYNKRRKPTLTSDKPPEYSKIQQKPTSKGVLNWDLNKRERFYTQVKESFTQEDKSIILDKMSYDKKKQEKIKKQSSFFASKSIKSHFDQIIYKSNNPFKVQIRKMLGFEDHSPGPGSYNPTAKSHDKKPLKFQFFGSTVERFDNKQQESVTVGPGDYQIVTTSQSNSLYKIKKPLRQTQKVSTQPSQSDNLGPGYYNTEKSSTYKGSFNRKFNIGQGEFGSRIPRFHTKSEKKKEDKSQYVSFMAQEDEQRKKRIQQQFNARRNALKNKKNCVFISQTNRGFQPNIDNNFGVYQVGVQDIGTRVKKQKQFSQQFAQCNLTKPGFLSSVQRFKGEKIQQSTHKDCWCQIKEVEKKNIEHMSPSFQSNCKRTEVFETKYKSPDVGQYSKQATFIKQSFNSKFIKQNQNKSKKIKIWKQKQL